MTPGLPAMATGRVAASYGTSAMEGAGLASAGGGSVGGFTPKLNTSYDELRSS
jgi:hypothetical protein